MTISFRLKSLCFLLGLLLVIFIHLAIQITSPIMAQEQIHEEHYYVSGSTPTFTIEQNGLTAEYPDWRKITFSRLKEISQDGELLSQPDWDRAVGYKLSRLWHIGDNPAEALKLGDFQNSEIGNMTLNYVLENSLTEIDVDDIPLSAFGLVGNQTIAELVDAIPELENLKVKDVEPILDLVGSGYEDVDIGRIIDGRLGNLSLGDLDLEDYFIHSIPGLASTTLDSFDGWQNSFIEEIPGLWDLPFSNIFGNGIFAPGMIGIVDIAFGTAEAGIDNTISGSYEEGFSVPCEEECAHVELANWALGKRWISGKYQKVKGGRGLLGLIKGGFEPTGRHPFGDWAKVVVWDTDEAEGRVDTALFLRYCRRTLFVDLGCTPYVIGPISFLSYHETDTMFVGLLDDFGGGSYPSPAPVLIPVPPDEQPLPPQTESEVGLINPLPGATVTSEYGYRNVKGGSRFHTAIDEAYPPGDSRAPGQIIASGGGVVVRAQWAGKCGNWIKIQHSNGLATGYCHMSAMYVKEREQVVQGQVIGQVGSTGSSTADHLHFIVYEGAKQVNPRKYVNF